MSLGQALSLAGQGLKTTNAALAVTAGNIANADTPGYTRKIYQQSPYNADGNLIGIDNRGVTRALDLQIQRQYRMELSGYGSALITANYFTRLEAIYGEPGTSTSLDATVNSFAAALETLSANTDSQASRVEFLSSAQIMAGQLNSMTGQIQDLRMELENGLEDAVAQLNDLLTSLSKIDKQIQQEFAVNVEPAGLLDERDKIIDELSSMMDVRVVDGEMGGVRLYTTTGLNLYDGGIPQVFQFSGAASSMNPQTLYSTDPDERGVGTIELVDGSGTNVDLIREGVFQNGTIASAIEMRDVTLVEAQAQLDELAAALALSMSNYTVDGTAVAGPPAGFSVDSGLLQSGNTMSLSVTDSSGASPVTTNYTFVRVDDPTTLPLSDDATADPNDTVIGIDYSGASGTVAAQIQAAVGAGYTVTNPSGTTIQIVDDGSGDYAVDSLSANVTATSLQDESLSIPLFTDGADGSVFSDNLDGTDQKLGFAGRITVNDALLDDDTLLIVHTTSPQTGMSDTARPLALIDSLRDTSRYFEPMGVGTSSTPPRTSVLDFAQEIVAFQGLQSASAQRDLEAEEITLNGLQQRFQETSKVDIDTEMALLIELQTAYTANARVMQAVQEMMQALMRL